VSTVERIFIAPLKNAPTRDVAVVEAIAGEGLEGDRNRKPNRSPGAQLTLIEAEHIEAFARATGYAMRLEQPRRNVVTRGVRLNDLVGKRFRVGDVECRGVELCEPCTTLQGMTKPGVIKGLAHRGGLNADILSDGAINVGDAVVAVDA